MSSFFFEINFPSFNNSKSSVTPSSYFYSKLRTEVPLYIQSLFIYHFYLSDLFHRITCHHSYPSDLFHQIISQDSISYVNSICSVSRLLYLYSMLITCFLQYDIFHRILCHQSYLSLIFHQIVYHYSPYLSVVSDFLVAYSEISFL